MQNVQGICSYVPHNSMFIGILTGNLTLYLFSQYLGKGFSLPLFTAFQALSPFIFKM